MRNFHWAIAHICGMVRLAWCAAGRIRWRNRFETPRRSREELAAYNIPVNAVTPAAAKTAIFEQITQAHIDYMLAKIPRNRFVRVEEVAARVPG